jgi:DNA helicase-2/ATP-dependent DNA helicase PcrA
MNEGFEAALASLNKQQKQAVDYIDGPLLVIAGPGTGKTQLLSLRVANILKQTDTSPDQILCLTFTNAAVTNMRERLLKLVGPMSRNVNVRTFHSFASEIMAEYPDYFWNGARLSVVPEAVQKAIIEDILSELPLNNPLSIKFAGNFTATPDVLQGLRLAKEAGLTPAKLSAMIEHNNAYINEIEEELADITSARLSLKQLNELQTKIDNLPDQNIEELVAPLTSLSSVIKSSLATAIASDLENGKTTETGKWKRRWIQSVEGKRGMYSERSRNDWWLSLATVYELYRNRLHERGYYDYSDMIVEVILGLEQKPELLALVQERYLYVLIDEFQDTNAAQLRLAHLVAANPITEDRPNLMAVGDDDQSIFAFNGAELGNMLSFMNLYPKTEVVVLTDNYRSTQAVLDASNSIISQAEVRLAKNQNFSKDLTAKTKPRQGEIKHYAYPTREHQLQFIARHIKAAWAENSSDSIAVLARSHASLRDLTTYLAKEDVPLSYEQQNNILELELTKQIILLSQIVSSIGRGDTGQVNYCLSNLLAYPAWKVAPKALWHLALTNSRSGNWLDSLSADKDSDLQQLSNWLISLSALSKTEPLEVVIEYLVGLRDLDGFTSPLMEHYLTLQSIDSDYLSNLSGLAKLTNLVHEFVATKTSAPSLEDFIDFITINNRVTDNSWYASSKNAVQLLTVHKAKGLEFDHVYIIDANDSDWQPRRLGRKPPANLPLQPYGELFDDYVRLAYVAATRSRSSLVISSYMQDSANQPLLASILFNGFETVEVDEVTKEDSQSALLTSLSWPRLAIQDEKLLLAKRLEDYRLSATGLIQFLDVSQGGPQQFFERQLLRLPSLTTPYMAYGTAMHAALQTAQNLINQGEFKLDKVYEAYNFSLKNQRLLVSDFNKYLEHGKSTINRLFNEYDLSLQPNDLSEVVVSDASLGSARINGALDHIHINNKSLLITDYKTGKPLTSFSTKDQTKAVKAWRQKTQLLFYCLLVGSYERFKGTSGVSAQITYVEADTAAQLNLGLTPEEADLARIRKLIEAVWKRIEALDFPDVNAYSKDIAGIKAFEDDLLK